MILVAGLAHCGGVALMGALTASTLSRGNDGRSRPLRIHEGAQQP